MNHTQVTDMATTDPDTNKSPSNPPKLSVIFPELGENQLKQLNRILVEERIKSLEWCLEREGDAITARAIARHIEEQRRLNNE